MKNKINRRDVIFLHPGDAVITNKNKVIYTILGSCVAITMHVPRLKIGAIVHCLLPEPGKADNYECSNSEQKYKYISCAIPLMTEFIQEFGIKLSEIEVKIFGGSNLLITKDEKQLSNSIGRKNIIVAENSLKEINLNIKACDTGGNVGRKIYFFPSSGEVYLNRLKKADITVEKFNTISAQL